MGFNTELLHGTKNRRSGDRSHTPTPVYQSRCFLSAIGRRQHEKLFHNKAAGYSYTRINNPTIAAFEERMTVLEKGVASVACASGMAAITNALLNIVGSGDEIITSTSLYGGTIDLYHDLEAFGITTIFADTNDLEDLPNPRSRIRRESSSRRRLAIKAGCDRHPGTCRDRKAAQSSAHDR